MPIKGPAFLKRVKGTTGNIGMKIGVWRGACAEGYVGIAPADPFNPSFEVADLNYCRQVIDRLIAENDRIKLALKKSDKPIRQGKITDEVEAASLIKTLRYENVVLMQELLVK